MATKTICKKYRAHALMFVAQMGYTFLFFITEASFNHGMNPHVYITYRHIVGGIVMLPFAYLLERKIRPRLTLTLFLELFILSLLGRSLTLNMYFASLKYTSPTFVTAMVNIIPSLTFVLAIVLRLEPFEAKSTTGIAKIMGTIVSLSGAMTMTLYKGPVLKNLWSAPIHIDGHTVIHKNWLKGSLLAAASCVTWSIWYIMQALTLKRYPAQLSLTSWMSFIGAAQSAAFTVIVAHKPSDWMVNFNIDLWSTLYGGVVCSGLIIFVQLWCTEEKGPVFVAMFNPVSTVMVAFLAYFAFGEALCVGSMVGGAVAIVGLYSVLWGIDKDKKNQRKLLGEEREDNTNMNPCMQTSRDIP